MTRPSFTEALATRPWLLADGATGTNYFQMGLESGDAPEMWNFDHPERVRSLHRRFIEAGADIVLTNSFGGNRHRLKLHNAQGQVRELNIAAAKNARAEADAAGRPVYVGGSVGPTGEIMEPIEQWQVVDIAEVERADVTMILDAFRRCGRTHIAVVERRDDGGEHLRGLFSYAKITRLLSNP